MKKKQTKNNYATLENIFAVAGLGVVLMGIVASFYSAYTNQRFIHAALDNIYYFRWAILLGGGFALSFLFAKQLASRNRLYDGVFFAFLSVSLFWVWDTLRVVAQNAFGSVEYPWSNVIFTGSALFALVLVLVAGFALRFAPQFRSRLQQLFVASFLLIQLYVFVQALASLGQPNFSWMTIGSFFLMPIFITALAYIFFDKVKQRSDRIFYATFIGVLYATFGVVAWEFHTDPTVEATNLFNGIVAAITISITALVVWKAQRTIIK